MFCSQGVLFWRQEGLAPGENCWKEPNQRTTSHPQAYHLSAHCFCCPRHGKKIVFAQVFFLQEAASYRLVIQMWTLFEFSFLIREDIWFRKTWVHCKKVRDFPVPSRMSLTKLFPTRNNLIISGHLEFGLWHPGWGDGKIANLSFTVYSIPLAKFCPDRNNLYITS